MTKKQIKKLKKLIRKTYRESNQILYCLVPYEYNDKKGWTGAIDVYLSNEKGDWKNYLFEIGNYYINDDIICTALQWEFQNTKRKDFHTVRNVNEIANKPLYMNQQFLLKKFKTITEEDVVKCLRYFVRKVLNVPWIFNFEMYKDRNDKEKNEKKNNKSKNKKRLGSN